MPLFNDPKSQSLLEYKWGDVACPYCSSGNLDYTEEEDDGTYHDVVICNNCNRTLIYEE